MEKKNFTLRTARSMAVIAFLSVSSFAALIKVDPEEQINSPGELFQVNVVIADLASDEDVGAFDLDLSYDNSVIEFVNAAFPDQLSGDDLTDVLPSDGMINLSSISLSDNIDGQADSFRLATVTFKAVAPLKTSPLMLSVNYLGDAFGNESIAYTTQNGTASVPEPGLTAMLLSGVAAIGISTRRKRRN